MLDIRVQIDLPLRIQLAQDILSLTPLRNSEYFIRFCAPSSAYSLPWRTRTRLTSRSNR